MVPSIVLITLTVALLLVSLTYHSLREFSRSELEAICKKYENESRLSAILKNDERATIATELVQLAILLSFCWRSYQGAPDWVISAVNVLSLFGFGYVLPRSLAMIYGESFIYFTWPAISGLTLIFKPVISVLDALDTLLHRIAGRDNPIEGTPRQFSDEIRTVLDEGERDGVIESSAGRIMQRLIEIQNDDVTAVMTPRTNMICIQVDTPIREVCDQLFDAGHSRVPVYRESPDDLVGILYAKDLFQQLAKLESGEVAFASILRDPLYVPETMGIESLLERMRQEHVHMAIVLDEYGGVVGLVTMEDILEEIVGDIEDEYDKQQEEEIRLIEPGMIEVDAHVHIDDLNKEYDFALPEDGDYDTIGGFVFTQLGTIPKLNETFTWQNLRITILEADKRKVVKLRIEKDESLPLTV